MRKSAFIISEAASLALAAVCFLATPVGAYVASTTEEDGSPDCYGWRQKFGNGSVTDNGDGTCSVAAGAPTTADYIVGTANGSLSAEQSLGALTTGLTLNTVAGSTGTLSAYAGGTCGAGDFVSALNASGALTCTTPAGSGDITAVGDTASGAAFNALNTGTTLTFSNATSGTIALTPVTGALGTVTLRLPAATDTLVGKDTTDTLTNKTLAAANNVLDADTAVALAANGGNCTAGNYPLGVDASGAVESCTAATTGTVTSVATASGITGGTITTTGTIALDYTATLAGNPTMLTTECRFTADGLICEGTTADAIEIKLAFPDPVTTDKTITFFNATDTVVGKDTTDTLTNKTLAAASNVLDADTAVALAADPANCSAGSAAGGITAAGVAESCLDPIVSTEIDTSAELAAILTDETGTAGKVVFDTTPTLVTPVLGVATATSINKVAITAPATSATLTIADGKTLTVTNTVNLNTLTDGTYCKYTAAGTTLDCNKTCADITGGAGLCDGVDADSGGATAWDAIGDPTTPADVAFAGLSETISGNTNDVTAIAQDVLAINFTNDAGTDILTQRLLVLNNASATGGTTETMLAMDNQDNSAVTTGLSIVGSSTGAVTTAIDVSDAEIGTALAIGANDMTTAATTIASTELDRLDGKDAALIDLNDSPVITGAWDAGGATSFEVPNGAAPTVDAAGEVAVDTTDDQFVYYGGAKRVVSYKHRVCKVYENLVAADDNMLFHNFQNASTVVAIACRSSGFTTQPVIQFEDDVTPTSIGAPTSVTCDATSGTAWTAVTTNNTFVAGEAIRFDQTATTAPITGTQALICFAYTDDAQ